MPPVHRDKAIKGRVAPEGARGPEFSRGRGRKAHDPFLFGLEAPMEKGQSMRRPFVARIDADTLSPLYAFLRLRELGANVFLESLEEGRYWGRYSFIGFGQPALIFPKANEGAWRELGRYLKENYRPVLPGLPPFQGGLVGHLSYDLVEHLEPVPLPERALYEVPQMAFLEVRDLVVFDNLRGEMIVIARSERFAKDVALLLKSPNKQQSLDGPKGIRLRSSFSRLDFCRAVEETRQMILEGEAIQVVLAHVFEAESLRDPLCVYRHLRRINPSPYMFFIQMDGYCLLGASPEVMVRLTERIVETRPIAGTRPRTGDPERDRKMLEELLTDEKEAAEHVMLVDLARNDLGRISEIGSVEVTEFKKVEAYSHVFHLVSHVRGRLKEGLGPIEVIKATFPAGTLSGAPKVRAMQIISEKEPVKRGFYGGAVGYIDFSGNLDTAIAIRSLIYKDSLYYLGAGAGIVADSIPEREYMETLSKAKAVLLALGMEEEDEVTGNR